MTEDSTLSAIQSIIAEYKIPVAAIATLRDLLEYVRSKGGEFEQAILTSVQEYRETYGVS